MFPVPIKLRFLNHTAQCFNKSQAQLLVPFSNRISMPNRGYGDVTFNSEKTCSTSSISCIALLLFKHFSSIRFIRADSNSTLFVIFLSLSLSLSLYIYIYIYIWRGERGLYYTQCMCICVLFSVVAVTCSALKLDTSFVKHQGRPYVGNVNTRETYTDKCTYMQICISTLKGQNSRSANGNNRCHSLEIFDVQYFVNELHFKCTIRIQQGYF